MISIQNNFMQTCVQPVLLVAIAYFAGSKRFIHVFNGSTQMGFYVAASGTAAAAFIQQSVLPSSKEESIFMTTLKKTMCVAIGLAIASTIGKKLNPKCVLNLTDGLKFGGAELLILQIMQMLSYNPSASPRNLKAFNEIYKEAEQKQSGYICFRELASYFEGELIMSFNSELGSDVKDQMEDSKGPIHNLSAILYFTTGQNFTDAFDAFKNKNEVDFGSMQLDMVKRTEIPTYEKLLNAKETYLKEKIKELEREDETLKAPIWMDEAINCLDVKVEEVDEIRENFTEDWVKLVEEEINVCISLADLKDKDKKSFFESALSDQFKTLLSHFESKEDSYQNAKSLKKSLDDNVIKSLTQNYKKRFSVAFISTSLKMTFAVIYDKTSETAILMDPHGSSIRLIIKNHLLDSLFRFYKGVWPEFGMENVDSKISSGKYSYSIAHIDPFSK